MEQDEIVNRLIEELDSEFILNDTFKHVLKNYLNMAYACGADHGRDTNKVKRPVAMYNNFGEKIGEYKSIREAATKNEVSYSSVYKVAKGDMPSVHNKYFRFIENG